MEEVTKFLEIKYKLGQNVYVIGRDDVHGYAHKIIEGTVIEITIRITEENTLVFYRLRIGNCEDYLFCTDNQIFTNTQEAFESLILETIGGKND